MMLIKRSLLLIVFCFVIEIHSWTQFKNFHLISKPFTLSSLSEQNSEEENNVYLSWTVEEDKMLYNMHCKELPLHDMCQALKRGPVGVKSRIKNILNPKHTSFLRLFNGTEEKTKLPPLRPCTDVIKRLLHDKSLPTVEFSFIYEDRFRGDTQCQLLSENLNVKGKEHLLINAIPPHRIKAILYKKRAVSK